MFPPTLSIRSGITAAATLALVVACNDSPAEPAAAAPGAAFMQADGKGPPSFGKGKLHFAQVRGADGVMVSGSALASTRQAEGTYRLTFEPPIGACAATANTAAFQGAAFSVLQVTAQVNMGFGQSGAFDDESVIVRLVDSEDGSFVDTSFTLTMICP